MTSLWKDFSKHPINYYPKSFKKCITILTLIKSFWVFISVDMLLRLTVMFLSHNRFQCISFCLSLQHCCICITNCCYIIIVVVLRWRVLKLRTHSLALMCIFGIYFNLLLLCYIRNNNNNNNKKFIIYTLYRQVIYKHVYTQHMKDFRNLNLFSCKMLNNLWSWAYCYCVVRRCLGTVTIRSIVLSSPSLMPWQISGCCLVSTMNNSLPNILYALRNVFRCFICIIAKFTYWTRDNSYSE